MEILEQLKENYVGLINDKLELIRAEEYAKLRKKFTQEYNMERFRKLSLEKYTNVKNISKDYFGYKVEFGEYKKIGNPKVTGPGFKSIIYKKQETGKYVIGLEELSDEEAIEAWEKLKNYIADFIDNCKNVNNYDEINYFEKFNLEKIKELFGKDYFKDNGAFNRLFNAHVPGYLLFILTQLYPDKFIGIKSKDALWKVIGTLSLLKIPEGQTNCIYMSFAINKYIRENVPELNNKEYDPIILFDALVDTFHLFQEESTSGEDNNNEIPEIKPNSDTLSIDKEYKFISDIEFNKIINLLNFKKNIILEGVPGVGKTYIAMKIAQEITGGKEENIKVIQFHQSYAYEDFVQGLRPTDRSTFEPVDGVLKVICDNARKDIKNKYVVIIDEINRGKISKIFGETFMLIEKDKRIKKEEIEKNKNSKYAVILPYSKDKKEKFDIPENVYFIGTMNTMDKSIALMDFALRRRFGIYEIKPCFEDKDGNNSFNEYLSDIENEKLNILVEKIKSINNSKKLDEIKFGHSYFCGLKQNENLDMEIDFILNYEILPQLKEYLLGDNYKIKKLEKFLSFENTEYLNVDKYLNKSINDDVIEDKDDE